MQPKVQLKYETKLHGVYGRYDIQDTHFTIAHI